MKKNLYRIYFLLRHGGWKYVIGGVIGRIWGHEESTKFLYKKIKALDASKYEEELYKISALATGKEMNISNPVTFNEKIQWLKIHDATPLKTMLADKYLVNEWVREKVGEQYLIPILGVWDSFEEIKIDELPKSFVLKANHGSGWLVVVKDKTQVNWAEVKKNFDLWMSLNFALIEGFELQYLNIKPKIIAEEYIENESGWLYDYKIHCFNGKPEYIQIMGERSQITHHAKHAFYNTEWELQPFVYDRHMPWETKKEKPVNLDEMLQIADKLCKGFAYVRVDLYQLDDGEIKFGEMTFTPESGYMEWTPPETSKMLGEKIILPQK